MEGWLKRFRMVKVSMALGYKKLEDAVKRYLKNASCFSNHVNVAFAFFHKWPCTFHFNVSRFSLLSSILSLIAIRVLSRQLGCIFQDLLLS